MRRAALAVVATIAGLVGLLSFKTHASAPSLPVAVGTTEPGGSSGPAPAPASSTPASSGSASSGSAAKATGTKTVTGDSVDTRWGPVQVRITVTNGKLTAVSVIRYPDGNGRDQEINSFALPALTRETLAAGNAKIQMISGATYTSQGYIGSLQSALDKAGL